MQRVGAIIILSSSLGCYVDSYGVVGAKFKLSDDSPLPRWLSVGSGSNRKRPEIEVIRYEDMDSEGRWKIRILVHSTSEIKEQSYMGVGWWHPQSRDRRALAGVYPAWFIIRINGVDEVYELRGNNRIWIVPKSLN